MKKYFVKYLPVEGEIKEGDSSIKDGIRYYHHSISQSGIEKGHQKVKLFLCTKDIQVGDKVKWFGLSDYTYSEIGEVADMIAKGRGNEFLKVVGEISPGAIWIKEGDEFNEDQVEEWYWHLKQERFIFSVKKVKEIYNNSNKYLINLFENNKELFKRGIFKIKCSQCNTFH